jgi:hypothetical protein
VSTAKPAVNLSVQSVACPIHGEPLERGVERARLPLAAEGADAVLLEVGTEVGGGLVRAQAVLWGDEAAERAELRDRRVEAVSVALDGLQQLVRGHSRLEQLDLLLCTEDAKPSGGEDCHGRHTTAFKRIPARALRPENWAFAERHGLTFRARSGVSSVSRWAMTRDEIRDLGADLSFSARRRALEQALAVRVRRLRSGLDAGVDVRATIAHLQDELSEINIRGVA